MYALPVRTESNFEPIFLSAPNFGMLNIAPKVLRMDHSKRPHADERELNGASKVVPLCNGSAQIGSALRQLRSYRSFNAGWDGRVSAQPIRKSFELAEDFLSLIASSGRAFFISPELYADGTAVLHLTRNGVESYFQFLGDGTIAAVVGDWDSDCEGFTGGSLPDAIADRLELKV